MHSKQFCKLIDENTWLLGDSLLMQWSETLQHPKDLLAQWPDGDGHFSVKKLSSQETIPVSSSDSKHVYQTEFRLIHEAGDASVIWATGTDTICKIKIKTLNVCSEANIIAFVRENLPSLPLPEVLYSYDDHDDFTVLFLRRVQGETLRDAWVKLTEDQKNEIVDSVTEYCILMANQTSDKLTGVGGTCVLEPYLYTSKDTPLGPLTVSEARSLFEKYSSCNTGTPDIEGFHFYHPDLGPGNIMVHDGAIASIIDWEAAGYYPRFWIATKPSVSSGLDFYPAIDGVVEHEWRKLLKERLISKGFPWMASWWEGWRKVVKSEWT